MNKNSEVISSISRKNKLNIIVVVFILFVIISILVSINPIVTMISKRNQIATLESKLTAIRQENIKLLAIEKSLYDDEAIKKEALRQFNVSESDNIIMYKVNEVDKLKRDDNLSLAGNNETAVYSNNNLWENLKILYYKEIYKP